MTWAEMLALKQLHGLTDADLERVCIRAERIEESYEPDGAQVYVWSDKVMEQMARLEVSRLAAKLSVEG